MRGWPGPSTAQHQWEAGATTFRVMVWVFVTPAPVAVTVRVEAPVVAVEEAVRVSLLAAAVPMEDGERLAGEKVAVTPLGKPVRERATEEVKPFCPVAESVRDVEAPLAMVAVEELAVSEKLGAGETVRVSVRVFVTPAPVAEIVRVELPVLAVEAEVSVNLLVPLPGEAMLAGAKAAVTPLGKPVTEMAIAELKALRPEVERVIEVDAPAATLALEALADNEKLGAGATVRLNV